MQQNNFQAVGMAGTTTHFQQVQPNVLKRKPFSMNPPDKVLSRTRDLGFAGVYPQRGAQDEDELSESNVKHGFQDRPHPILQDERFSAFELYYHDSNHGKLLNALSGFVTEVLKGQVGESKVPNESRYKLPDRVATDAKQWIVKLASETEPLSELAKSVPLGQVFHGNLISVYVLIDSAYYRIKGGALLDHLVQHQVPIARATWFVRFVGASEIRQHRQPKQAEDPNQHSAFETEWTTALTVFMKRLFESINAPQPTIIGPTISKDTKRWSSSDERKRFMIKWNYVLGLIRYQYAEGLIDQRGFLRWSLDSFKLANFDQTFFVLQIVTSFITEIVRSRALTRYLMESCISKLQRYAAHLDASELIRQQQYQLSQLLQYIFMVAPDLAVAPRTWTQYKDLILGVMDIAPITSPATQIQRLLSARKLEIQRRNEFLLYGRCPVIKASQDAIEILDSMSVSSSLNDIYKSWFDATGSDDPIHQLFQWAITFSRSGNHRPYVVGAILTRYAQDGRLGRRRDLQTQLQVFLDTFESSHVEERRQLSELYGEIIRKDLFSLDTYIQRLISRGDLEASNIHKRFSHIKDLPIYKAKPTQLNHRRVSLFGVTYKLHKDDEESRYMKTLERISSFFPMMFRSQSNSGVVSQSMPAKDSEADYALSRLGHTDVLLLQNLPKFIRVRVAEWLVNHVFDFVVTDKLIGMDNFKTMLNPGNSKLNGRQFAVIIEILEAAKEYRLVLGLCIWMLHKTTDRNIYPYIVDTFRRHQMVFHAMEELGNIFTAVYNKHSELRKSQKHDRNLILSYLIELMKIPESGANAAQKQELTLQHDEPPPVSGKKETPAVFDDIRKLQDDYLTIATAISNLTWSYQSSKEAVKRVFLYVIENLRRLVSSSKSIYEFRRIMEINVEVLRVLNDRCLFLDDVIIECLQEIVLTLSNGGVQQPRQLSELLTNHTDEKSSWMLSFLALLMISRIVTAARVLRDFVDVVVKRATDEGLNPLFTPLYINVIRLAHIVLGVSDTEDLAPGLFLTTQELQSMSTIRQSDLMSGEPPVAPFRTYLLISRLSTSPSILADDAKTKLVVACLDEFKNSIYNKSSWLKRVCLDKPVWAYKVMVAVSTEVDSSLLSKGPEASIRHFANCAIFQHLVSEDSDTDFVSSNAAAPSQQPHHHHQPHQRLTIESCRDSFAHVLRKMNDWTFDRPWIELQFILDRIVAFGESQAGTSSLMYFDCFVDLLFERLLEPSTHIRFFSRLVEGLRWEVLSRFLQQISWLLEGILPLPPGYRHDPASPRAVMVSKWSTALAGDERCLKVFMDVAVLAIQTADRCRVNGDGRYGPELIAMAKALLTQLQWFESKIPVFDLMEICSLSFQEASRFWQQCNYSLQSALENVRQGRLAIEKGSEQHAFIGEIRAMLYLRLRLILPLIPVLLENAQDSNLVSLVQTLVCLMTARISHGMGTEEKLFELILDIVSWISDEVPKELKNSLLAVLRDLQPQLCIPEKYLERIQRMLPFQIQNPHVKRLLTVVYPPSSNTLMSSSSSSLSSLALLPATASLVVSSSHFKPWEWVESSAIVAGPQELDFNLSSSATAAAASAATHPEVVNDGPISLSLFSASVRVPFSEDDEETGGMSLMYNRLFEDGWQPGDITAVRNLLVTEGNSGEMNEDVVMADGVGNGDAGKREGKRKAVAESPNDGNPYLVQEVFDVKLKPFDVDDDGDATSSIGENDDRPSFLNELADARAPEDVRDSIIQ
ncbi:hypothetical protein SmJEL517_g06180 [Synchytrium microbalum]|uniref:Mediator of RNA polymerase II transcription subunit 12 n=1 Tax=Synchytrium microbalum TaxID=1806994 RepID=A0A507BQX6_9FUNG|nr:uncharacterized protein SmJEL517_g06180 [Synchytrium microbalum]TPX30202.1 hypothetical protein SmJEL517_g06180 [Synchytrium microbalum]